MKYITSATENRIKKMLKNGNKYAEELDYMLNNLIKSSYGCMGSTVKEMKSWGINMKNENFQISVYFVTNLERGMSINFEKYFNAVDCFDLHYLTFKDFNELVRVCECD